MGEAEAVVIIDDLMASLLMASLGNDPSQFISLKACLNSSSSAAVGSITSITEAVPDSADIKPLFIRGGGGL